MMSSSFWTVAAWTGAATHCPPWLTWRSAATRNVKDFRGTGVEVIDPWQVTGGSWVLRMGAPVPVSSIRPV